MLSIFAIAQSSLAIAAKLHSMIKPKQAKPTPKANPKGECFEASFVSILAKSKNQNKTVAASSAPSVEVAPSHSPSHGPFAMIGESPCAQTYVA